MKQGEAKSLFPRSPMYTLSSLLKDLFFLSLLCFGLYVTLIQFSYSIQTCCDSPLHRSLLEYITGANQSTTLCATFHDAMPAEFCSYYNSL